jgi:hypothetical protein
MALAAVMAVGASAQAQVINRTPTSFDDSRCPNGVQGGADKTNGESGRILDFGGVSVDGCVEKPDSFRTVTPPHVKFPTMIKMRANFTPELEKTVGQL